MYYYFNSCRHFELLLLCSGILYHQLLALFLLGFTPNPTLICFDYYNIEYNIFSSSKICIDSHKVGWCQRKLTLQCKLNLS